MGKKKATGMSKRLGFTDRQTINENKDILRYNERLEREALGLPPDQPRTPRGGPRGDRRPSPGGSDRPPRRERPVRPPALDDEQLAALRTAYLGAVGESGLEPAAEKVLERLLAHDGFERASMAGWEIAAGGHADERTAEQWELLRKAWLDIRLALLEAYAVFKPEAAEALAREKKQQARLAKPPRPRRRPASGRRAKGERPAKGDGPAAAPRVPSPSAIARMAAAAPAVPTGSAEPTDGPTDEGPVEPATDAALTPAPGTTVDEPGVPAEVIEAAAPADDVDVPSEGEVITDVDTPLSEPVADLAEIEVTPETDAALESAVEPALDASDEEPGVPAEVIEAAAPADDVDVPSEGEVITDVDSPLSEPVADLAEIEVTPETDAALDASDEEPVADSVADVETVAEEEAVADPEPVAETQPVVDVAAEPVAEPVVEPEPEPALEVEESEPVDLAEPEPPTDPIADSSVAEGADPVTDPELSDLTPSDSQLSGPEVREGVAAVEVESLRDDAVGESGAEGSTELAASEQPVELESAPEHEAYAAPAEVAQEDDDAQLGFDF